MLQSLVYPVRSCRDRVHFRLVILYSIHVERATQRHSRHHLVRPFFTLSCEEGSIHRFFALRIFLFKLNRENRKTIYTRIRKCKFNVRERKLKWLYVLSIRKFTQQLSSLIDDYSNSYSILKKL